MSKNKLKPGDKFKVVHNPYNVSYVRQHIGKVYTVAFYDSDGMYNTVERTNSSRHIFHQSEIELIIEPKQLTFVFHD